MTILAGDFDSRSHSTDESTFPGNVDVTNPEASKDNQSLKGRAAPEDALCKTVVHDRARSNVKIFEVWIRVAFCENLFERFI